MDFEWDATKSEINFRKHGLTFEESKVLWSSDHVIIPARNIIGEERYVVLGIIRRRVHMAIFTYRDDKVRIISCHRADKKWERYYEEAIKTRK